MTKRDDPDVPGGDDDHAACTEAYNECMAARRARVEAVIAERKPWETQRELAEKAGVSRQAVSQAMDRYNSQELANCNSQNTEEPRERAEPREIVPPMPEQILALYEASEDDVKEWLATFKSWPNKKRRKVWMLFANLTQVVKDW